jgi:hypothetical protein
MNVTKVVDKFGNDESEGNPLSTVGIENGSGDDDFTSPKNYVWGAVTIP